MSRRLLDLALVWPAVLLGTAGCRPLDDHGDVHRTGGEVARAEQAIVNGEPDTVHSAVCAVTTELDGQLVPFCTATIIGVDGSTGYAISAAHCASGVGGVPKADFLSCVAFYGDPCPSSTCLFPIESMTANPAYDGGAGADLSVIKFSGASGSTPIIPIAGLDDGLEEGTPIEVAGYGLTNNLQQTDGRRHAFSVIGDTQLDADAYGLYVDAFEAPQSYAGPYGGACSGDSGGPVLVGSGAATRVVGTTSQGDQECNIGGYYTRLGNLDNYAFVAAHTGGTILQVCDACTESALGGACAETYEACVEDAECKALLVCVNACASGACVDDCTAARPRGVAGYEAIFACAVCQECDGVCQSDGCSTSSTTPASTSSAATGGAGGAGGGPDGGGSGGGSDEEDDGCSVGRAGEAGSPLGLLVAAAGAWSLARRRPRLR